MRGKMRARNEGQYYSRATIFEGAFYLITFKVSLLFLRGVKSPFLLASKAKGLPSSPCSRLVDAMAHFENREGLGLSLEDILSAGAFKTLTCLVFDR